jgi:hypothetical protein
MRQRKPRRIPKPKRRVLARVGKVSLLELTRPDNPGVVVYAAEYPHKVGGQDTEKLIMSQHLVKSEAEEFFNKMVRFYSGRKEGA